MIKELAKWILRKERGDEDAFIQNLIESEKASKNSEQRLSELVNRLSKELVAVKKGRMPREYAFAPESLTTEEQATIGAFVDTDVFNLYNKWFKFKADQNNDLYLHEKGASDEQRALWKLAVLMYDDWRTFNKHCLQVYDKSEKEEGR
jgi:hypothetical protein